MMIIITLVWCVGTNINVLCMSLFKTCSNRGRETFTINSTYLINILSFQSTVTTSELPWSKAVSTDLVKDIFKDFFANQLYEMSEINQGQCEVASSSRSNVGELPSSAEKSLK